VIDQDAGVSESDRRKKKKRSKAEKEDKAHKDKVHGSVSTDPVPVLEGGPLLHLFVPPVVPEAVGGPMSITAVSVALCKDDSDNGDLVFEKKKKKKEQKKHKKTKREVDLRTAVAVPVLEEAQQGLHAVKEEKIAP
jgi:hypothetical protein